MSGQLQQINYLFSIRIPDNYNCSKRYLKHQSPGPLAFCSKSMLPRTLHCKYPQFLKSLITSSRFTNSLCLLLLLTSYRRFKSLTTPFCFHWIVFFNPDFEEHAPKLPKTSTIWIIFFT